MKKLSLISLAIFTALSTFAETPAQPTPAPINLEQEKAQWQHAQNQANLTRLAQRETFLQVENLLRSAVKNQQLSENTQQIVQTLIDSLATYPLQNDLILRLWESKVRLLKSDDATGIQQTTAALNELIAQNRPFITPALQALQLKVVALNAPKTEMPPETPEPNPLANAKLLPEFIKKNDITPENKTRVLEAFPRYLKTLPEQMANPNFEPYQQWAQSWQLSDEEIKQWKIAFLTRFFDNDSADFQAWRDAQIPQLKADNLTERRLRMAIWQKTPLSPWLNTLSAEGQNKQEWRYWAAKQNPQKMTENLTALAKERGFYPMLAAAQLKQPYVVDFPTAPNFTATEQAPFEPAFAMLAELRALGRHGLAKQRWRTMLDGADFNTQLKLTQYAQSQQWYDLTVDGTIAAKAWDYLALRLPNAYPEYFKAALQNLHISQTFAMAIARQESAWNPMAQSSANARGLMQLLPATAKFTAENAQLSYQGEQDLFKPLNNILLGTAHLNELNDKYPGNRLLIAAAYNAGANRVDRWLARANGTLALDEFVASIPYFETRGYVQNVVAYDFYYQLLQHKENPQTFSQAEWDRLY